MKTDSGHPEVTGVGPPDSPAHRAPSRSAARRAQRRATALQPSVGNVGRNMVTTIVGNLFPPMALLITAPLLAHTLGVAGRGQVAGAVAPLILAITAATFGAPQAVTFAIARSPAVMRRAVRGALMIIIVAGAIATLAVILAAQWLGGRDVELPHLIVVASLGIVPGLILTVLRGTASGLHLWRNVALEQFVSSAAELLALIALALAHELTPLTATIVLAFSPVTGAVAYLRLGHFAPVVSDEADPLGKPRNLFGYGSRVWIGAISGILLSRLDQAIMTPLADVFQLGLYATAVTVSQVPLVINSAVRDVTFAADAAENMNERLARSARISSTACGAVGLFVGLTMSWWLPWLFGVSFRPAIPVAGVLILAVVLGTPGSIAGAGLSARGRPGLRSTSLVIACVVNLVLLILLVPPYGAMGAAEATLIGNVVSSNGCIFFLWRIYGVDPRQFYGIRRSDWHALTRFVRRLAQRT